MTPLDQLIGDSTGMASIREQIQWLVRRQSGRHDPLPVLLLGEPGTGKGLTARVIHASGSRADGPFIRVNCAARPEALLDAELVGFEEGAGTGAGHAKSGLFGAAAGGTIFLDEVSRLSLTSQTKVVKILEQRIARRIGSSRYEIVDACIVAASSHDLLARVQAGAFRADLYHRLAVGTCTLPPLRQRGVDIVLLAEHFLARACAECGAPPRTLANSARAALLAHSWPGNVRELANLVERVVLFSEAPEITAETFDETEGPGSDWPGPIAPNGNASCKDVLDGAKGASAQGNWSTLARVSVAGQLHQESDRIHGPRWIPDLREPSDAVR